VVWVFVSLVVTHETFLVSRMTEYCCPAMAPALYSMCNAYGKRDLMAYDVGINSNSGFFPKPNERKYRVVTDHFFFDRNPGRVQK
jgi:hypothetical protein